MATYPQRQAGNGSTGQEIPQALERQRRQVEQLAHTLAEQATDQWRKAIEGMVALPAAVAVGGAASALFAVGFVARGFEVFQRTALEVGDELGTGRARGERERAEEERGRNEVGRQEQPRA
jgi:hypothetical protein